MSASYGELESVLFSQPEDQIKKRRPFKKFFYRGVDLDQLLDMKVDQLASLFNSRARRTLIRGLKQKHQTLLKKLRKSKKECPQGEKPSVVKTHLRNMIVLPEMVGSVVGVYNGKTYNSVEIRPEMIGHYLGEFSITYKPVKHGRPGIGATHSSRFIPLK
ncbi:unnamed protein product [Protopolystoma xenopodis]|uniref:40S ribosomal protein S15 n=1 Tax=Protopolystoma xenopodis TaxID=117903 RepID=A0A3S5AY84_9PLAT|nr:unnamed protein product [Protopolystoma xenopodis]